MRNSCKKIKDAYDRDANLPNLLLDPYFKEIVESYQFALRQVIAVAIERGIPVPSFSSAIAYYDSYRTETLPANLLQAQRDYFWRSYVSACRQRRRLSY
ncbi:hypothetical protein GCM10020331_084200 [Ectobacillus funiculus]